MFSKHKKRQNKKQGWFFWSVLGFYVFKKIFKFKKSQELQDIEHNFKEFLHKETKEIKEYTKNKEDLGEFVHDSSNIFKDYFIPHTGNNHTPKILRTKSLSIIILLAFLLKFFLLAYLYFVFPNTSRADNIPVSRILELINKDRAKESLSILKLNQILSTSAQAKAQDMVNHDYFAHTSPDGKKPWDWINRSLYPYSLVGENLAMNFTTAESAHRALMNSPSHKHNIMSDKYQDIGLAIVNGHVNGKKTNILVQVFSTPVKKKIAEKEVNSVLPSKQPAKQPTSVNKQNKEKISLATKPKSTLSQPQVLANKETFVPSVKKQTKISIPPINDIDITAKTDNKIVKINQTKKKSAIASTSSTSVERVIKVIEHPGDIVLAKQAKMREDIKLMQIAQIEKTLPAVTTRVEDSESGHFIFSMRFIKATQIAMAAILSLLIIALFINIFVRFEIQHKPVLVRTTLAVIFVLALLFLNLHYLEGGASLIYMS